MNSITLRINSFLRLSTKTGLSLVLNSQETARRTSSFNIRIRLFRNKDRYPGRTVINQNARHVKLAFNRRIRIKRLVQPVNVIISITTNVNVQLSIHVERTLTSSTTVHVNTYMNSNHNYHNHNANNSSYSRHPNYPHRHSDANLNDAKYPQVICHSPAKRNSKLTANSSTNSKDITVVHVNDEHETK